MDITILFKACVKTVRTTNKNIGVKELKTNILKTSRDNNLAAAREIVKQITNLQEIIVENRAAYLNVINYLSTTKTMTEIDRQQVDTLAHSIISKCSKRIADYKQVISKGSHLQQQQEHYNNIIESLEKYLKGVSKVYTETKAIRVKRVLETHKLSKLETKSVIDVTLPNGIKEHGNTEINNSKAQTNKEMISLPSPQVENIVEQLSPEELQMFESENEMLFNELNSLSDEVKQIEGKVIHITELQELFTEKVLQQEQDIERISTTVSTSTDNVRDANQQIRQAIQRNAGLRVWVLFFLLVMSFSLLFLDWYND